MPRTKSFTPSQVLLRWGLRVSGSTLKRPMKYSTGGRSGEDLDLILVAYLEGVPGFYKARPVLVHCFCNGLDASTFRLRLPGESRIAALERLGWMDHSSSLDTDVANTVLIEFTDNLRKALKEKPLLFPVLGTGDGLYDCRKYGNFITNFQKRLRNRV